MQSIPLQAVPAQICSIVLGGQNCQLNIYQKPQGLFIDISSDDENIMTATICRDIGILVSRSYTGFLGNLFFIDTQGSSDPFYSGLNSRFQLIYLTEQEYAIFQQ